MGFNYARERKKFEREWKKLLDQYKNAGMSEQAIQELYQFDLEAFCSERTYFTRTQPLPDLYFNENNTEHSTLMKKFKSLSITFDENDFTQRYSWIETISSSSIANKLKKLPDADLELLTLYVIEGYTQSEIAKLMHCNQSVVSRKLKRIQKFLKG